MQERKKTVDTGMAETFQATAGFQGSAFFQKAIKMALRCTVSVIFHLSGFKSLTQFHP